jgi:hypothetical protein
VRCPYCDVAVRMDFEEGSSTHQFEDEEKKHLGYDAVWDHCPECRGFVVVYRTGKMVDISAGEFPHFDLEDTQEEILYPRRITRKVAPEVPERYAKDFVEACATLHVSPKASAALSRRLLQDILHNEFHIEERTLHDEIDKFMELKDVPSYLTDAVDAVRNIGNFAAHPSKDSNTGEVVDVEPGEAEWLLEVLEALFDFTFVQPKKLEARKQALNEKLKAL